MALILLLNIAQLDSYRVFRLYLGIFVGKAREFILKNVRIHSNTVKKLLALQNYTSLILIQIMMNKIYSLSNSLF